MTKIAVIPARGGSKRIPRKNIKDFHGKPIMAYSIKAALESQCFDRVIVSTDDDEIAEVAIKYGAEIPFMRNKILADDYAGTTPVIQDAIRQIDDSSLSHVCCLYATAPMLDPKYIKNGLECLQKSRDMYFAFSVTSYAFPIQRAITVSSTGVVSMLDSDMFNMRSQDLEECWHDAGQFYWGTKNAWLEGLPIFDHHSIGIKLPRYLVQDIDTLEDWRVAEILYSAWRMP